MPVMNTARQLIPQAALYFVPLLRKVCNPGKCLQVNIQRIKFQRIEFAGHHVIEQLRRLQDLHAIY